MAVKCKVSGEALVVTRDRDTYRLPLAVPMDRLSVWLDMGDAPAEFFDLHTQIRDDVMGPDARESVLAIEQSDAVDAVQVVREWSLALRDRLGKVLSPSFSGGSTEPPSPPTSGSDSE